MQILIRYTLLKLFLAATFTYAQLSGTSGDVNKGLQNSNEPRVFNSEVSLNINQADFKTVAILGAAAYLTARWDQAIDREYALEDHQYPFQFVKRYGQLGELYDGPFTYHILAGSALASFTYSYLTNDQRPAHLTWSMMKALTASTAITYVLKSSIGRHRPYTGAGPSKFEALDFSMKTAHMSFPSGHTSSIFALMTVLAKSSESRWVQVPAYSFAVSVGFQRMLDRKHWASDVMVGGLIGYLAGKWAISNEAVNDKPTIILPFTNGKKVGLSIVF